MSCLCIIGGGVEGICGPCLQNAQLIKRLKALEENMTTTYNPLDRSDNVADYDRHTTPMIETPDNMKTFTLKQSIEDLNKDLEYEFKRWVEGQAYGSDKAAHIKTLLAYFAQAKDRQDTKHDVEVIDSVARALLDSPEWSIRVLGSLLMTAKKNVKEALAITDTENFYRVYTKTPKDDSLTGKEDSF